MNQDRLIAIYDKTHGYCHICHKKLSLRNYGVHGAKGSWHIEHSIPKAKGGTDHLNNLFPACIPCNLEKGISHTNTVRKRNGVTRAPYSKAKKDKLKNDNMLGLGALGFVIGAGIYGPLGGIIFAVLGSEIGKKVSLKR
ncbi:MAG TPA: HNH endonuclease signature motif containing protein [Mucilaginibacter sp.]|jgi:5-methylcytosine-specific restriction endonuclease McrA|nr:HNH endonuclease signature motif containing protein [Mucilaginibacter sp.]